MKKTKWQALFIVCQFICMFVVPVLCLWLEYGSNAFVSVKYKISITGIIFVLLFFSLSKRFWLNDSLKKLQAKISNIETDALSMTDQQAIATAKKVYKRIYSLRIAIVVAYAACAFGRADGDSKSTRRTGTQNVQRVLMVNNKFCRRHRL